MHALIVVAHPDPKSLTHSVAAHVAEGVSRSGAGHSFEIADLAAEGFDPRFTAADLAVHRGKGRYPPMLPPSRRGSTAPMPLCSSIPSTGGRCRGSSRDGSTACSPMAGLTTTARIPELMKKLRHLQVHLVAIGGARRANLCAARLFRRHEDADRPRDLRLLRRARRDVRAPAGFGNAGYDASSGYGPRDRPQCLCRVPAMRDQRRSIASLPS